ncbi:MAG: Rqc2 family fibronectin-binding protein [Chloroflexota bacterium]|nr:MAG: hypothetical protein DLM70_18225 [Chloroflexota bacterium]
MPFDAMTMAAVTDEVGMAVTAGRTQKIIQPSINSVALAIYAQGHQHWVLLSSDPQYARVQLSTERLAKAFSTPSPFVMLLRKHLEGARVASVTSTPSERVLTVSFESGSDRWTLLAEVMGRHSNVVLVSSTGSILGSLKSVSARQSPSRPILPGAPYVPPPKRPRDDALYATGERVDPCRDTERFAYLLSHVPPDTTVQAALMGLLPGASPFLVHQIATRADSPASERMEKVVSARLVEAGARLFALYQTRDWRPCTFVDGRARADYAPYIALGVSQLEPHSSISSVVDACTGARESRDSLGVARKAVIADIARRQRMIEGRIASLEEGLLASQGATVEKEKGQLILAYSSSIATRAERLEVPDMNMTIALDPFMSASENAERHFRRYKKLRDASVKIPGLLENAHLEVQSTRDAAIFAQLADSENSLNELRREIQESQGQRAGGRLHRQADGSKSGKRSDNKKARGPARYRLGGAVAIVGKNAHENEEVTFRLGRREDLWLHARQRTGAHVILQGGSGDDAIVIAGGELAAYFSEGRADSGVDVDVTQLRNVRKIPGGPMGRVTYSNFRTLRVKPGIGQWETVRK